MKKSDKTAHGFCIPLRVFFTWFILLALGQGAGCSDSTNPVPNPEDLSFQHTPSNAVSDFLVGDLADFSLSVSPDVTLDIAWSMNGQSAGQGKVFNYDAAHVGIDTLNVEYSYSSVTWSHTWYASVDPNTVTAPDEIPWVILDHGPVAADVVVRWHVIPSSTYPLSEYQVKFSYGGEITDENWNEATLLGTFPIEEDQVGHAELFSAAEHGLIAGSEAWFAVRGLDEVGQFSPLAGHQQHLISSPWFIEGYVYSDRMIALPEVIIDYGCPSCRVNTDANGFYSIGPLPNVNSYTLTTFTDNTHNPLIPETSWYDYSLRDVPYDPLGTQDIVIITRYDLSDFCSGYGDDYLTYFKNMTHTSSPSTLRPNNILYRWEEYPIPVYVPNFTNEHGLALGTLCRSALGYINQIMEEEYLYLVDSPEEAKIVFYYGDESVQYTGRVILDEPSDESYSLGDVIPERMLVYISDQLSDSQSVEEVALHELGHTLGFYSHGLCIGDNFLMIVNSQGSLDSGPENAMNPNEKRGLAIIRHLPQATDMNDFQ